MNNKDAKVAKSLFNYQRARILQVAKNEEKTVKEIAEILNEKPSRLYYHINQLEEIGLLKIVGEKKINNLTQKYYKSVSTDMLLSEYTFSGKDASKNADFIFSQLYAFSNEAITKIQEDLQKENNEEVFSEASIINVQLTRDEWKKVNQKIREIITSRDNEKAESKKWDANYIIMSYLNE